LGAGVTRWALGEPNTHSADQAEAQGPVGRGAPQLEARDNPFGNC